MFPWITFICRVDCIFRTKSKPYQTPYKRGGLCQPGPWLLLSTENISIFKWCYQCCNLFLKYSEGVLNLHQAWHSPITLPTMIHGEVICTIINWFAPSTLQQSSCLPPSCHLRTFYFDINRKKRNRHMQSVILLYICMWYTEDNDFHFVM